MFRFFDILALTVERIWQQRVLVLWTLLGLTAASTLALSIVLYIDAVNTDILDASLDDPAYAYRFRYLGAWNGNIGQADVETATATVRSRFTELIGLPTVIAVDFVRTQPLPVQLAGDPDAGVPAVPLGSYGVGALEGIDNQISITSGAWTPERQADTDAIPVLLPEAMLYETGVQVGDRLRAQVRGGEIVEMEVAALWLPLNENDPAWIFPPKFFDTVIIVPQRDLWGMVEGVEDPIEEAAWYTVFEGASVRTSDVPALLDNTQAGLRAVTSALPGTRLDLSPEEELRTFSGDVRQLTQQLVIIVLPVVGVVLYFVTLVAGLLVSRQQNEDILLRSRGMSRLANLGIHGLMWALLAGAAFGVGLLLAPVVAVLVGRTTSFLRFDGVGDPLQIVMTGQALAVGITTSLLAASTGLYMAYRNTFRTITSFKQESARTQAPWWQRTYLDMLLLVPGGYVLYTLTQQGGLALESQTPFSDPLTFIGPTLFTLGMTLLFLRVFPFLLRLTGGAMTYTRDIPLLMALRELTRSAGRYRGTLLMMCFTLALTGFTASMADTIDRSLRDTINYTVGADAVIVTAADAEAEEGEQNEDTGQQEVNITGFSVLPTDDLLRVPGVYQVSRVGDYPARLQLPSGRAEGRVLGVDREGVAAVTRYRDDFSTEPLADLANHLARARNGVIVDRGTLEDNGLLLNQELIMEVEALGEWYETRVQIVGVTDYFPTLNPHAGFFLIGNMDPIFEAVGTPLPHDIWLALTPDADPAAVQAEARALGFPVVEWKDPQQRLRAAQANPSRRGVLGFLSIGFVAATLLTLIGAIIQSSASFRAQASQLGALRAMGLSGASVGMYLIFLQGINTLGGVLGGTGIGVATTLLFLPLMDFSGGLPPYLVSVAWGQLALVYGLFAGALFVIALVTTAFVSREQLAQVARLGDV